MCGSERVGGYRRVVTFAEVFENIVLGVGDDDNVVVAVDDRG